MLHASVKRDPTNFSTRAMREPIRLFLARTAPRSDAGESRFCRCKVSVPGCVPSGTTNRPVLFLEGVRPRGARRSRNFLHYLVWGKGGNLGTFFSIQFGKRGAPLFQGARPWRAFWIGRPVGRGQWAGVYPSGAAHLAQQDEGERFGGGPGPSIACRLAIEWPLARNARAPPCLHRNRRLHVGMRSDRDGLS